MKSYLYFLMKVLIQIKPTGVYILEYIMLILIEIALMLEKQATFVMHLIAFYYPNYSQIQRNKFIFKVS